MKKNDDIIQPHLIKNTSKDYNYDYQRMYLYIDEVQCIRSRSSVTLINNTGCQIKISECKLLKGSSFDKIPKIFYTSKVINIIKNKDKKCFLYCYIRKYLNPVKSHSDRVNKIDKEYVKKLENELEYNFDDVKVQDLEKNRKFIKNKYLC